MSSSNGRPTTLPYDWYIDAGIHDAERSRVFAHRWQYAGHVGQLPGPSTLSTADLVGLPVVLARDEHGKVRAFVNMCRHRGTRLVSEDAERTTIQCPYHAWTYDLQGQLRSAPRSPSEPDFDLADFGLQPLAVDHWGPFIFVNPHPDAAPLAETLGQLPDLVASAGVDVDALRFHSRSKSTYAANWKICCENFLECYHCQVAHPGIVDVLDVSEDGYRLEEDGLFSSQYGPVKTGWKGEFNPEGSVPHGQFHFLYPNITINISPGAPNISIGPVIPEAPDRTRRFLDYFFDPGADNAWVDAFLEWDDQVGREDAVLVETVQRGVGSGALDRGVLFESERLILHFDRLLQHDLEADLD
jgi:choline monooxygenase